MSNKYVLKIHFVITSNILFHPPPPNKNMIKFSSLGYGKLSVCV